MSSFICNSRASLQLAEVYANVLAERGDGDHPFASPINPETLPWCICGRCVNMDQSRENVCCRKRVCCTTEEYFRATTLDHNVLQLQIRLAADYRVEVPNYSHNGYRKAAYRQYILSQYAIWVEEIGASRLHVWYAVYDIGFPPQMEGTWGTGVSRYSGSAQIV